MMKCGSALFWVIALLALGLSSPALAVDGVLEINEACAVNIGCFSGDVAGLPVKITAAGSYRLTSNLTVPDENTDGIVVSADDVSIDMNGFAIIGPVTCTGLPLTCTHTSGTGDGIVGPSAAFTNTSVRNGSVTGMGNHGVSLGEQAEVTDLRVRSNRSNGIYVQTASTVMRSTAHKNGGTGIRTESAGTVSDSIAHANGTSGIYAQQGSTVSGNTVRNNGHNGIGVAQGSTVSGNTAYNNASDGIEVAAGSTVLGNTARSNTGYGLNLSADTGYSGNVVSGNTGGTVSGTAVQLGQNACNGNTTCP